MILHRLVDRKSLKTIGFLQHFLKFGFLEKVGVQNRKSYVFELQKGATLKLWGEKMSPKIGKNSGTRKRVSKIEK